MRRRQFLLGAGGALAASACYGSLVEPKWLDVTHTTIDTGAQLRSPVRILHLTDLHASWCVPMSRLREAIAMGLAERPDLICLTGDYITDRTGFDPVEYVRALRALSAAAPCYAVVGNHDGGMWTGGHTGFHDHALVDHMLADSGIHLLHNRSAEVQVRGQRIWLAGLGDRWNHEDLPYKAFRGVGNSDPCVLLAHNPDSKDDASPYPWQVMLSGHTHGGQVVLPGFGPLVTPVEDKRYVDGLGRWRGRSIYVSRGVGTLMSLRINCRPEVALLTLV